MYDLFDIENWLYEHSTKVTRSFREIIFEHGGDDRSILLTREVVDSDVAVSDCEALSAFYRQHGGGYIGNGFLLVGTPSHTAIKTTTGVVIPSLEEIHRVSEEEGLFFKQGEIPFMTTGYMFVYSFLPDGRFCTHDRDFHRIEEGKGVGDILNNWWQIKMSDEK